MKVLKVRLVAEWVSGSADEWLDSAPAPVPSCATCKWAEVRASEGRFAAVPVPVNPRDNILWCARVEQDPSLASLESPVDGGLIVAPTFGCVQWEGK